MDEIRGAACALLLVITANAAPWLVGHLLGTRWATPLDFGIRLRDGRLLLGPHKTWRGLVSGALACGVMAQLTGSGFMLGVIFGVLALVGDALSSAAKRRIGFPSGREVPLLDQLPEALLPLIVLAAPLGLSAASIGAVVIAFVLLDVITTRIRHVGGDERARGHRPG
jgi:hypothetical protein